MSKPEPTVLIDPVKYPTIYRLMSEGVIVLHRKDLVGIASDGAELLMGDVYGLDSIETYLVAHPSPSQW